MFRPLKVNYKGGIHYELIYICIPLPDDELVEVETCKEDISDKFIIDCAICWIE